MRILFLSLCLFSLPSTATPEDPDQDLQPIYAVKRLVGRFETVYVLSEEKAKELAEHENYEYQGLLGFGSKAEGPGKTRLFQAYKDGWHIYYTELPRGKKLPAGTKLVEFPVWVWERGGQGRSPVFACSHQDWRNMRYSLDSKVIDRIIEITKEAKGVQLKNHRIVFYLYPPPEDE